jgi:hypothetical protein
MHNKEELCQKIIALYPDIGQCGIDVKVEYDEDKKAWTVDMNKESHQLKTYLEPEDADTCMAGKQCVSLSLQVAQLVSNIKSSS